MRDEVKRLVSAAGRRGRNVHLAEWSLPTMWGGTTLLQMHLRAMRELAEMRASDAWRWHFVLNLSETDFPLR